jgi:hypothetical protein
MGVENKEEVYAPIFRQSAVNRTIESEHAGQACRDMEYRC